MDQVRQAGGEEDAAELERPLGRALPLRVSNWSLTSLQQRLVKTGGQLVKHVRYYWLLLAEGHLTRRLSGTMVRRIEALTGRALGRAG